MARENKRVRDAKRFGTSDRLADNLLTDPSIIFDGFSNTDADERYGHQCRMDLHDVAQLHNIDATNVSDYTRSIKPTSENDKRLGFKEMIRGARPPFLECFVEMMIPGSFTPQIRNIGWGIGCFEKFEVPQRILEHLQLKPFRSYFDQCAFVIEGFMAVRMLANPNSGEMGIIPSLAKCYVMLDLEGNAVIPPILGIDPRWEKINQDDWASDFARSSIFDVMLAFAFMNCKNVTLTENSPDPKISQSRRNAGIKPFLRYNTINIEPMKSILRTEGGIETNGLKKALHICRGHFSTYRETFMGRKLEKPLTFWVPSCVKGSAKNGVVVSDYNVNPPGAAQ